MKMLKLSISILLMLAASITLHIANINNIKSSIDYYEQIDKIQELADIMKVYMTYDYNAAKDPVKFNIAHIGKHYTYDDLLNGISGLCTTYAQVFTDIAKDYDIYCKRVDNVKTKVGTHSFVDILFADGWYRFDITSYCNSNSGCITTYLTKK